MSMTGSGNGNLVGSIIVFTATGMTVLGASETERLRQAARPASIPKAEAPGRRRNRGERAVRRHRAGDGRAVSGERDDPARSGEGRRECSDHHAEWANDTAVIPLR